MRVLIKFWATLLLTWGLVLPVAVHSWSRKLTPVEREHLRQFFGHPEQPEDTDGPSLSELVDTLKINSGEDSKEEEDFGLDSDFPDNVTLSDSGANSTEATASNVTHRVNCTQHTFETNEVELVDSTRLINLLLTNPNVTSRQTEAECVVVLFYATWCPFCSLAAPHFNALPRAYPNIKIAAVDSMKYASFNTQYGVVGVPTVILFHNGRIAAKYNQSEYVLGMFVRFIEENTGIPSADNLVPTHADRSGPVPTTVVRETDYCLWMAWIFIAFSAMFLFTKSSWCQWIVEAVQNTWRESEAQHEHIN